jgi:hypothetical protein
LESRARREKITKGSPKLDGLTRPALDIANFTSRYGRPDGYDYGSVDYSCGFSDDAVTYFKIKSKADPDDGNYRHFYLYDCGTDSTYNNCTAKDPGLRAINIDPTNGESVEESYHGGSNCGNRFMGWYGDPTVFGGSNGPIEGEFHSDPDTWQVRPHDTFDDAACDDYAIKNSSDSAIRMYDTRN